MFFTIGEKTFCGFVSLGKQKYAFHTSVPENSQESVVLLKIDWRLKSQLGDSLLKFLDEHEFKNPTEFFYGFTTFVENNLNAKKEIDVWLQSPLKMSAILKSLQQEIINSGDYVKDFDIECGIVNIEVNDVQSRTHKAVLKLDQNYKIQPVTVLSHDLPLEKPGTSGIVSNIDNIFSVAEFCEKFLELIAYFQEFWNMVALIDSQCCILDPSNPTFRDNFRRIKLSDTVSIVVTFNSFCPSQMPSIKFLGCQSEVNYYQTILQKNLENELWDIERDLLSNLSNVLEISIPSKIYSEESEVMDLAETGECAICFTQIFENKVPSEICENSHCQSIYHSKCLFAYLSSVPQNRNYFGKIQGECPNCNEVILCNIPKFT